MSSRLKTALLLKILYEVCDFIMYETLKYYVLKAWSLGLSGEEAVQYVCDHAGVKASDVLETIDRLSMEMSE